MHDVVARIALFPRVVVELGMGDGRLLESLAKRDDNTLHIGIELDAGQCDRARSRIVQDNVLILNGSFVDMLPAFPNSSVDRFLAVLPDPAYIDEKKAREWEPFYRTVYSKMKKGGTLQIVTEITDELLQPVGDGEYLRWAEWLKATFTAAGFALVHQREGAPVEYSTRCLDQFRGDPERIRMTTIDLAKK